MSFKRAQRGRKCDLLWQQGAQGDRFHARILLDGLTPEGLKHGQRMQAHHPGSKAVPHRHRRRSRSDHRFSADLEQGRVLVRWADNDHIQQLPHRPHTTDRGCPLRWELDGRWQVEFHLDASG